LELGVWSLELSAHDFPHSSLSPRRSGSRLTRSLPSHPPHHPRARRFQLPHVPAAHASPPHPPQPARTHSLALAPLRHSLPPRSSLSNNGMPLPPASASRWLSAS